MRKPLTEEQRLAKNLYNKERYLKNKDRIREVNKSWYERNKDKVRESNKKWKEKNLEKSRKCGRDSYHKRKTDPKNIIIYLLRNARSRAIKKNIEFDLVESDITLPETCPILGTEFDRSSRRYSYSLDRVNPNKGYTKDNVWVISQIANAMKWDSTHEERVLFAKWVLSLEGGYRP